MHVNFATYMYRDLDLNLVSTSVCFLGTSVKSRVLQRQIIKDLNTYIKLH
jgi:hypothetical protein